MSDLLHVFTSGDPARLQLLDESCRRVGIKLHSYDVPWTDLATIKLKHGLEYLSGITAPYVMWVDGFDSLMLKGEEEIMDCYSDFVRECDAWPVVIAAEMNCFPVEARLWPPYDDGLPSYVNAGGFIGPTDTVRASMWMARELVTTADDQGPWMKAMKDYPGNIVLDRTRRIFSSVADGQAALEADTCWMHWNGRMPGREEYWRQFIADQPR